MSSLSNGFLWTKSFSLCNENHVSRYQIFTSCESAVSPEGMHDHEQACPGWELWGVAVRGGQLCNVAASLNLWGERGEDRGTASSGHLDAAVNVCVGQGAGIKAEKGTWMWILKAPALLHFRRLKSKPRVRSQCDRNSQSFQNGAG